MAAVVVVIVGYRNADDVAYCLRALASAVPEPSFEVFVAENGGAAGMDRLIAKLDSGDPAWHPSKTPAPVCAEAALRTRDFRLVRPDGGEGAHVHVSELKENLGYAGGINAWLRPLLAIPGWEAVWVLNPDTEPEPDALAELAAYAKAHGKGMVGSCIIRTDAPHKVSTRGLSWNWLTARAEAIDRGADLSVDPNPGEIEARLVSPSGASVYATRKLIDTIGLMDERYFLYVEDLEWGVRAARLGLIGYAHRSHVPHKGGTTIGGTASRAASSKLSVYLQMRNRTLFVREKYPFCLPWTVAMQFAYLATFAAAGAFGNMVEGVKGVFAGLRGEVGRPEKFFRVVEWD